MTKRDPAAHNRPGARKVPMHPWSDPKHMNQPVTRAEMVAIIAQVDQSIDRSARQTYEALKPAPSWWQRLRQRLTWRTRAAQDNAA